MKAKPPQTIQKATHPSMRSHWNEMNRKQRREMMRKMQSEDLSLEVVHPHAAGIDIGNESHYVAVPPSRDSQPVRCFRCTTAELKAMADWLKQCGIRTVAMQSTGVYWIAVYDILEQAGLEVYLVNARDRKNLPGRKSDVQQSQWLMKLHPYGLLRNSFRPSQEIRRMRTYWRQRNDLVQSAGRHIQRMQKALTQMNIQLANVLSDVSGVTGQAIIKAILGSQRDPHKLAEFRNPRVRASAGEIARSLEGHWQEDLLFVLQQEQDGYEFCQKQMAGCDRQLNHYLEQREDRSQGAPLPVEERKGRRKKKSGNKPQFDLRTGLFRLSGTDLARIDSIDVMTATTILSEAGWEMSKWETEDHFRFLVAAVSGQSHQREQGHWERAPAHQQQADHRFKDGGQHLAAQRYLSGSAVPSIQDQARGSRRHQGDGGQAGPLGLPHAPLRDEIRGQRSGDLPGPAPAVTDQAAQVESRQPGIPTNRSSSRLKSTSFWGDLSFLILWVYALVLTRDSNVATSPERRMKEMTANDDFERFRTGAAKYAAYLETPEGRLRLDLAFANLQDFLPQATRALRALDLGCGTGAVAVRLARLGLHVTLLDASLPMLDFAKRAAREAGVTERIALTHGDATQFANLFDAESFDVILCHNILEYVEDPCAVLRSAGRALRDPSSIISILVRNQAGEVLKAAIQDGDLAATEHNLTAEWGHESLYGGGVRLLTAGSLQAMLLESSLAVTAKRGVRVLSDYLPPRISRNDEYHRILELERKLGRRPEFAAVARYTHCLAHRGGPVVKDGA